jgi:uncharacterized protein
VRIHPPSHHPEPGETGLISKPAIGLYRPSTAGLALRVHISPTSSRDAVQAIETTHDGAALKVRVRAIPDKGAANSAWIDTVAAWRGVAKRAISLDRGRASRVKTLLISGDPAALERALLARLGTSEGS